MIGCSTAIFNKPVKYAKHILNILIMHNEISTLNKELSLLLLPYRFFDESNWEPLKMRVNKWINDGHGLRIGQPISFDELNDTQKKYLWLCTSKILDRMCVYQEMQNLIVKRDYEAAAERRNISSQLANEGDPGFTTELPVFKLSLDVLVFHPTGSYILDRFLLINMRLEDRK